jgi:plasmid stability protein
MSTLVIKNLPEELHARLKEQAQRHHRSVTKEVVSLIEAGLEAPAKPPMLLPTLQPHGGRALSLEEIEAAIADGRFARYRTLDEVKAYVDEMRADRDVAT